MSYDTGFERKCPICNQWEDAIEKMIIDHTMDLDDQIIVVGIKHGWRHQIDIAHNTKTSYWPMRQ